MFFSLGLASGLVLKTLLDRATMRVVENVDLPDDLGTLKNLFKNETKLKIMAALSRYPLNQNEMASMASRSREEKFSIKRHQFRSLTLLSNAKLRDRYLRRASKLIT